MLIALKAISEANLKPCQEITTKFNLSSLSPETVKGIIIKKNMRKRTTHLKYFSTKENGILDKKTKTIAKMNPKKADKILGSKATDKIKKEKEISLTRGSQEWNTDLRCAYLSISGR